MIMLVQLVLLDSLDNLERDSRPPTSLCSPTSNALLYHGHPMQTKMKKLLEQFSFLYLCTFPFNKLMSMCLHTKKTSPVGLVLHFSLRRERDSNPRSLSAQRFSRPPQSTTLPSLLRRNALVALNSLRELGRPRFLLLTRSYELLVIFSYIEKMCAG